MRKKLLLILVSGFVLISPLFCDDAIAVIKTKVPTPIMRSMSIGGMVDNQVSVSVNVISGGVGSAEGSPFDLAGDDVMSVSNTGGWNMEVGRKIAYWTIAARTLPVSVTITADVLQQQVVYDNEVKIAKVPYILRFSYRYAKYDEIGKYVGDEVGAFFIISQDFEALESDGNPAVVPELVNTVNADRVVEGKFTFNKTDDIDQFFVVENGEVRVFIPEYAWEVVKNDDYRVPPGTYNAVVKISVEADE